MDESQSFIDTKVTLDKCKVAAVQYLPQGMLTDSLMLDSMPDFLAGPLAFRLTGVFLRQRLASWQERYEQPTTWWQHLKKTLNLKYDKRISLVRVERYRTYPSAHIVLPEKAFGVSYIIEEDFKQYVRSVEDQ